MHNDKDIEPSQMVKLCKVNVKLEEYTYKRTEWKGAYDKKKTKQKICYGLRFHSLNAKKKTELRYCAAKERNYPILYKYLPTFRTKLTAWSFCQVGPKNDGK